MMRGFGAPIVYMTLALACGRGVASETGAAQTPVPVAHAAPKSSGAPPAPPLAWAEAVRAERWDDAARAIRELPADAWRAPEVRFAFARISQELGDPESVVEQLDGLESELPIVALRIERLRAEAQLEAGPFDAAASFFTKAGDPESNLQAALALERAGSLDAARKAVDRTLAELGTKSNKVRDIEVRARVIRARIAERQGNKKLLASDLRWLATRAPLSEECDDVDTRLESCAPKLVLNKEERLARARSMADAGLVDAVTRELEALPRSPGAAPKPGTPLFLKAWALYNARADYAKAAELFERSAAVGSSDVARDLFYAARSRSRAQDNEAALAGYQRVSQRFPQTGYAETATYLAARLHYTGGRWKEAAHAYDKYLSRYGAKARYNADATYERAIAWLASDKAEQARPIFTRLVQKSKDRFDVARAKELEAVALLESGKREAAIAAFQQVIEENPLTFQALLSAARLAKIGASVPPLISPSKGGRRADLEVQLPSTVQFYQRLGLERDAEAELRAQEKDLRRQFGARAGEALCQLYGQLAVAERRYAVGQWAAERAGLDVAPSEATRWMWDCVYPRPYTELVREVAQQQLLPEKLLNSIMRQESGFRPRVVSPAGAVGLMQLMPGTGARVAQELNLSYAPRLLESPTYNLAMGGHYLKKLVDMFGGNVALAAAGYNAGPTAVFRWIDGGKDLPLDLFVARIPFEETRGYVERVVSNLARYSFLAGGDADVPRLALDLPRDLKEPAELY